MSNTGVFAPPHGVVFAPHLGGAEKKNFRYANLSPYLYLTLPPTFQILEISLVQIGAPHSLPPSSPFPFPRGVNGPLNPEGKERCKQRNAFGAFSGRKMRLTAI